MKRKKGGRWTIIFLCCTLAVPTVAWIMGLYGPGQPGPDRLPGAVTGAGAGEGTVQGNAEAVRVRMPLPETQGGVVGPDRMGAGRAVTDFVYALNAFHRNTLLFCINQELYETQFSKAVEA